MRKLGGRACWRQCSEEIRWLRSLSRMPSRPVKPELAAALLLVLLAAVACRPMPQTDAAPPSGCRLRGQPVPCAAFEEHTATEVLVRFAEEQCTSLALSALNEAEMWNYSQANGMASFDERHHANIAIASAMNHQGCACNVVWRRYVAGYPQDLPLPECREIQEIRAGQVVR